MSLNPDRVFPVSTAARSRHGFTLIELLVAVTLLALVTMLTFGGFRFGTRAWERAAAHLDHAAEIQIVQAFLRRRLSEAAPVLKPGDNPDGEIFFEGDRTSLRFVTVMPIHLVKPCSRNSITASKAPPGPVTASRSSMLMTECNWNRSKD